MPLRRILAAAFAALALAGCGASDSALEAHFRQAISQIEDTRDYRALQAKLRRTLAVIESEEFVVTRIERTELPKAPKFVRPLIVGTAVA